MNSGIGATSKALKGRIVRRSVAPTWKETPWSAMITSEARSYTPVAFIRAMIWPSRASTAPTCSRWRCHDWRTSVRSNTLRSLLFSPLIGPSTERS